MRNKLFIVTLLCLFWETGGCAYSQNASISAEKRLSHTTIQEINTLIERELANRAFPGASIAVGDRNTILYSQNYGYTDYQNQISVSGRTLYDVASCTKVLATTFVTMRLFDQGKLHISQTVGELVPTLATTSLTSLTLQELLTHTSGLRPQVFYPLLVRNASTGRLFATSESPRYPHKVEKNLYMAQYVQFDTLYTTTIPRPNYRSLSETRYLNPAIDTLIIREISRHLDPTKRGTYSYNDSNFHLMKLVIEQVTGRTLSALTRELYAELDATHIGYTPLTWAPAEKIAPTEIDHLLRRGLVHGAPHDELAALSGGVGGNAGLFANTESVARFCQLILNQGTYNHKQILTPETIALFTNSPTANKNVGPPSGRSTNGIHPRGTLRGLGFDKRSIEKSPLGGASCVGHTGFTGTIFWLDQQRGLYLVFLSNSVHPTRSNKRLTESGLRTNLWQAITRGLDHP